MAPSDASAEVFRRELAANGGFVHGRREDWLREAERSLKGTSLSALTVRTQEGLSLNPLYAADDAGWDSGFPGLAPFTRGGRPVTSGGWEVCQLIAEADPVQAARAVANDTERGAGAVWVAFDTCARTGRDADDPTMARSRADGLVASTCDDLDGLIEQISFARAPVRLAAGGHTFGIAASFIAAAQQRGVALGELEGSFDLDPLGSLAGEGELVCGIDRTCALMPDLVAWAARHAPQVQTIAVSTVPYHMAGATAVDEIAYGLATGVEYLRCLVGAGIDLPTACRSLRMITAIGRDLFMEVAKLRALRRTWARVVEVAGGAPEVRRIDLHAVTSPRTLTVRDPWTNMLRVSVESFAAAVGGADAITTLPFDSAIGPSDLLGRRLATNTQTILREESHLGKVADPAGGSWYLERLTADLAEAAWAAFQRIEADGGMRARLCEANGLAAELAHALAARREAIATGRDPVTGVSSYPNLSESPVIREHPDVTRLRCDAAARLATHRSASDPETELDRVASLARRGEGGGEVFAASVEAAAAGATFAQLAEALVSGAGPSRIVPLPVEREGWMFERLREASDAHLATHGRRPQVFLAALGPVSVHRARSAFAAALFHAGGFETVGGDGFPDAAEAAAACASSGARIAVICSSDAIYAEAVPALAPALRSAGARTVVLAGRPDGRESEWRAVGVDRLIWAGCDMHAVLRDLLVEEGVLHD